MDVSSPAEPTAKRTVPAYANDAFPRTITVRPDDATLYVPNANAMTLEVVTTSVKQICPVSFGGTFVAPRLLEINPVYARLGTAFFPRCKTTKTMCSEFSTTEDS